MFLIGEHFIRCIIFIEHLYHKQLLFVLDSTGMLTVSQFINIDSLTEIFETVKILVHIVDIRNDPEFTILRCKKEFKKLFLVGIDCVE